MIRTKTRETLSNDRNADVVINIFSGITKFLFECLKDHKQSNLRKNLLNITKRRAR